MSQECLELLHLPESVWEVVGRKAKNYTALNIQLEVKSEKFETRLVIAAEMRLYILKLKPFKLETNVHYGDIISINCHDFKKLQIGLEGRQLRLTAADTEPSLECILKQIFDYLSIVHNKSLFDKRSPSLDLSTDAKDVLVNCMLCQDSNPHLSSPCGNFSTVYRARCDQMGIPFFEDVAWDIDAIYNCKDCHHFDVFDFDHLSPKQLLPLLASFENNEWFRKINFCDFKLTPEICIQLLRVLRQNTKLQKINLSNTAIKSDFIMKLVQVLTANSQSSVHSFDLSNNPIDDKGISHLVGYLSKSNGCNLVSLNLSGLTLTHKTLSSLADCFQTNEAIRENLTYLNLSHIPMKGEENSSLQSFLAQSNHLKNLVLAHTEYPLEHLFAAALRGCSQNLESLDISGCTFSKKPKETTTPTSWKHFFASVSALTNVDFSQTKLPSSALLCILEGLESNSVITDVHLNLSGCQLGQSQNISNVFNQSLTSISKIKHLDLSDNGLEHLLVGVFKGLASNQHLKHLSIGRNLSNPKPKLVSAIMDSMVSMLQHENNVIERLAIDGMRLKQDTTLLLNSLVTNNKLLHLDISGNMITDSGMKMLSKALLLNRKLSSLSIDNNQVGVVGLSYLASSLENNTTLHYITTPLNDMVVMAKTCLDKMDRTWKKIEACLQRNQSKHLHNNHRQDFTLEQWISNSFNQEEMNSRLQELSGVIEQVDALKLKRRTDHSSDHSFDAHFDKATACKKAFCEAKHLKKLFLEACDFCEEKEEDDTNFIHQLSSTVTNYLEWLTVQYGEKIKQDYATTLAVNSADELYEPEVSKEEGMRVSSQTKSLLHAHITSLKHSFIFDRTVRYNDLLLNSALHSTEQAICNAKGVCRKLSSKMVEEGLMGEQDPDYLKIKGLIDSVKEGKEEKRRSNGYQGVGQKGEGEEEEEEALPQRVNSNKVRRPLSNYASNIGFSLVNMDLEDVTSPISPMTTHTATTQLTTTSTTQPITIQTKDMSATTIDLDSVSLSSPRLTHLAKNRPRRQKNKMSTMLIPCNQEHNPQDQHSVNPKPNQDNADKSSVNNDLDKISSTPTSTYSQKEVEKINEENFRMPLPVIRSKNKGPELPPTRPKYTPKAANALPSTPVTAPKNDAGAPSSRNVDSTPSQIPPTPMRRHIPPGSKGLLIPSMDEIKAKRNTMRRVPDQMGSQPSLSVSSEKDKRLTDFSFLKGDNEESDKMKKIPKRVPPLPPKPNKMTGSADSKINDDSTFA